VLLGEVNDLGLDLVKDTAEDFAGLAFAD